VEQFVDFKNRVAMLRFEPMGEGLAVVVVDDRAQFPRRGVAGEELGVAVLNVGARVLLEKNRLRWVER